MMWFSFFAYWSTFDTKPPKWALDFWYKTELGAQNNQNAVLGSVRGSMTRATPLACFSWLLLLTGTIVGHSASIGSAICLFFVVENTAHRLPTFDTKPAQKPRFAPKPENPAFSRNFKKTYPKNHDFYFCFSQRLLNRNHFPTAFFARTRRALSDDREFASSRVHLPGAQAR